MIIINNTKISAILLSAATYLFILFCYPVQSYARDRKISFIPSEKNAEIAISKFDLEMFVTFMADSLCQGRASGSKGSMEAASKIIRMFKKYELQPLNSEHSTYSDSFLLPNGKIGHNIAGILPCGKKTASSRYVIVTAHYDHLGILNDKMYPGADKNASGVAALVETAHALSVMKRLGRTYRKNIIFVALDGKEFNMAGSKKLCQEILDGKFSNPLNDEVITKDKIAAVVNIDQIGSDMSPLKSGRKDYIIMLQNKRKQHARMAGYCNERYGIDLEIADDYYASKDFTRLFYERISDQRPFIENGMDAVMFTSGITMRNNKESDVAESLNYDVLRRRIILIFYWLTRL